MKYRKPTTQTKVNSDTDTTTEESDWTKALKHISLVEANLMKYSGRPGFNPYFYMMNEVEPLRKILKDENSLRTPEFYEAVFKLDANHIPTTK